MGDIWQVIFNTNTVSLVVFCFSFFLCLFNLAFFYFFIIFFSVNFCIEIAKNNKP